MFAKKVNSILKTTLSLSLATGMALPRATADDQIVDEGSIRSSRRVLSDFMVNPMLHQIYLEQQVNNLSHPVDRSLREFFLSDPVLSQFYLAILDSQSNHSRSSNESSKEPQQKDAPKAEKEQLSAEQRALLQLYATVNEAQKAFLVDFERYADVSMFRLRREVTPAYDRLDHIVEETARDLGFSPEAIANRKIYIKEGSGSLNAFTVSGSTDNIIVVVHSTLLEKMDDLEVRAVLGHEMGHIRAGHTVKGYLLDMMMTTIYRLFTTGDIRMPGPNEAIAVNFSKLCSDGKMNGEDASQGRPSLDAILAMASGAGSPNPKSNHMKAYLSMKDQFAKMVYQIPEPQRIDLLQRFMRLMVRSLKVMSAPAELIQYFSHLTAQLPQAGIIKVDPQQLIASLSALADAVSRAQEISADHFGSSISRNAYLASSMGKLMGIDFLKHDARERVLKGVLAQAESVYRDIPKEEIGYYMGSSHPSPVLRTHMIMNFSPVPDIFFANPFIRLLMLENGIIAEQEKMDYFLKNGKVSDEIRKQLVPQLEALTADLASVDQQIIEQLLSTEVKLREGGRNPRFDNMLQFIIVNKESMFEAKEKIAKMIEELKAQKVAPEQIAQLTEQYAAMEGLMAEFSVSLLKQVLAAYDQLSGAQELSANKKSDINLRKTQINIALVSPKSADDLAKIRALRTELTQLPEIRTKGSRIPLNCRQSLQ